MVCSQYTDGRTNRQMHASEEIKTEVLVHAGSILDLFKGNHRYGSILVKH